MVVNRNLIKDNFIKLTFELPDSVSPMALNHGNDTRVLGIKVKRVKLLEVPVNQDQI